MPPSYRSDCSICLLLQHARSELRSPADDFAGDHEDAVTVIMQRLRMFRRGRDMCLQDLEDEKVVLRDQAAVRQPAFEVGVAFGDQRRINFLRFLRGQLELLEFVDLRP